MVRSSPDHANYSRNSFCLHFCRFQNHANYSQTPFCLFYILQFPEEDAQQWVLNESCENTQSPVVVAQCGVSSDRLVNMFVLELATGELHMGKIRVHSCVAYA